MSSLKLIRTVSNPKNLWAAHKTAYIRRLTETLLRLVCVYVGDLQ